MKHTFDDLVDHLMKGGFFLEEAVEIIRALWEGGTVT